MKPVLLLLFLLAFTASAFEFTGKVVGVTEQQKALPKCKIFSNPTK